MTAPRSANTLAIIVPLWMLRLVAREVPEAPLVASELAYYNHIALFYEAADWLPVDYYWVLEDDDGKALIECKVFPDYDTARAWSEDTLGAYAVERLWKEQQS